MTRVGKNIKTLLVGISLGLVVGSIIVSNFRAQSQSTQPDLENKVNSFNESPSNIDKSQTNSWVKERFKMPAVERAPGIGPSKPDAAWIFVQAEFETKGQQTAIFINHRHFRPMFGHDMRVFEVAAGENEIAVGTDFLGSNSLKLKLSPGDQKTVMVGCNLKGWRKERLAAYYYIKHPEDYFYVKEK